MARPSATRALLLAPSSQPSQRMTAIFESTHRWASALALLCAPLAAQAQQGPSGTAQPAPARSERRVQRGGSAPAPAASRIDAGFARSLDNGCSYRSSVRGTLRAMTTGGLPGGGPSAEAYAPDLRIRVVLACPGEGREHTTSAVVRGGALEPPALERELATRGQLVTAHDGRQCTYTPGFRVEAGLVAQRAVDAHCTSGGPFGGGPRANDANTANNANTANTVGGSFGTFGTHPRGVSGNSLNPQDGENPSPSETSPAPRGGGPRPDARRAAEPPATPLRQHIPGYDQDREGRGMSPSSPAVLGPLPITP
jgi:hypothetical protein